MPAILVYLMVQLGLVLSDPRKSVRQVLRSRQWHVWALWSLGVVVVLGCWEFDPGLIVYLADPELLAGVILLMAFQTRRSLGAAGQHITGVCRRSVLRWQHARTCGAVGLRLYANTFQELVTTRG